MPEPKPPSTKIEATLGGVSVLLLGGPLLGSLSIYALHAVAFVFACRLLVSSRDWRLRTGAYFKRERELWAVVSSFAVIFSLPFFFSPYSSLRDVSELKWVLVFLALLMPCAAIFRSVGEGKIFRWCYRVVLFIIFLSAADGVVQFVTLSNPLRELFGAEVDDFGRRATGLLRNPIPFGHAMGALFWIAAAGVLVAVSTRRKQVALLAAALSVATFASVLLSQTRGAWLAIAAVAVLSVPLLKGKARSFWLGCLGLACVAGLLVVAMSSATRERLSSAFDSGERSNQIRLELWQANFEILKDHPFGIGYNANDQLMEETFEQLGFEKHEWMGHSHNEFVEIAVGSGWLGLILYLVLSGWLLWLAIRAFRRVSVQDSPWTFFILLSSILVQIFVNACALTDQMSTPGRFILCMAWAYAIVVPVELAARGSNERPAR